MHVIIHTRTGRDHITITKVLNPDREAALIAKECRDGHSHDIVDLDEFRAQVAQLGEGDRYFRDAWQYASGVLSVDLPQARVIHLAEIRRVRNAELVKEDINMLRAIEAGNTSEQSTVATKKQTLRDIPATFDITTDVDTPAKLKAKWPSELPARE